MFGNMKADKTGGGGIWLLFLWELSGFLPFCQVSALVFGGLDTPFVRYPPVPPGYFY